MTLSALQGDRETTAREHSISRGLNVRLVLGWEVVAYAVIFVSALGLRVWDLGSRALHHDESLHGYYAYQIFQGSGYEHTPLLHGPFQLFGTALTFFVTGGASDFSVRVFPALFGTALVALPLLFRSHLGRVGSLATSALIAFSPTLLYYSRFAREDVYIAVFTLGLVICVWGYLEEPKEWLLWSAAGLLALSFATKENTFITVSIFLVFLNLWAASDLARQGQEEANGGRLRYAVRFLAFAPITWVITAVWPWTSGVRRRLGLVERPMVMDVLIVLGMLAGPQFAAAIQLPIEAMGAKIDTAAEGRLLGVPTVGGLLVLSAVVGLRWRARVWLVAAGCFYVPYVLLFTSFFTNVEGFGSGIWESLDYWMGQHEVRRADQPDFYYLMFYPAYEFLVLALGGPALLFYSLRGGPRSWILTMVTVLALLAFFGADSFGGGRAVDVAAFAMLPVAAVSLFLAVRGTMFERFLVFWLAATITAYSFVGEKMPWLSVHTALPMVILAGYGIGRVWGRGPDFSPLRLPLGRPLRIAGAVTMLVVVALSVRLAGWVSYGHEDVPREFLFYTQTSADVPDLATEIRELADGSGKGRGLRVQVDDVYVWPWAWYLREYDVSFEQIDGLFVPEAGAVLVLAAANEIYGDAYENDYAPARAYRLRQYFPEDYRGIGDKANLGEAIGDFVVDLGRAATWRRWWDYFVWRDIEPQGVEGRLYVPLEYGRGAGAISAPPDDGKPVVRPTADVEGRYIIGRGGSDPGEMSGPVGVAVDGGGNVYVVDSGNARVQKFDAKGALVAAVGGKGTKLGRFNQPSDVAVDAKGNVYVTDTWNHRIQKFGPDLNPLAAWGKPTRDLINPGPEAMWGPRGIAVDAKGNVFVADTGTHRVRKFSANGKPLSSFGRRGDGKGEFEEPVGVAIGPDGSIFVADAGNARIQRFDAGLKFVAAFAIENWDDRQPTNKPYLEVLKDGRLLATDAPHGRVLLVNADGKVASHLSRVAEVPLFYPGGIALSGKGNFVYLTDGAAGHVRRFPLTDFALR